MQYDVKVRCFSYDYVAKTALNCEQDDVKLQTIRYKNGENCQ